MKILIQKFPNAYRFVLAIFFFAIALLLSSIVNKGVIKDYFPYIAVILLIVATWILYKKENKSLQEIGFNLKIRNILLLPLGIVIAAFAFFVAKYMRAIYLNESFHLASEIDYQSILTAFYFILPTVAVEEFLFRGYLFKKTIEVSSFATANVIFSVLFMLIHILDESVLQKPGMLILLIISIPVGHLLFSVALLKSKSIYFPIGLHLGNNWATRHLVSSNTNGDSIFYVTDGFTFETWTFFILFVVSWNLFFLLITYIIWKWDKIPFLIGLKKE